MNQKKLEKLYEHKDLSPWVYLTYDCSCRCEYCMVPTVGKHKSMTPETFQKMIDISEQLIKKEVYDKVHFRLSGGEPFLVWHQYKDIIAENKKKFDWINFGFLTNLVTWNDKIAEWMEENNIGMQVSLDDLVNGKPLVNGKSSSSKVLENIQKLQSYNIQFSINTVLDITKTKSLKKLANFISSFKNIQWGLNASYTENNPEKIQEVINIFDECIQQLVKKGFDIFNNLRFYNSIVGKGQGGCSAGVNSFAIGTELEIWPCQAWCDKEPIGYYDENIKQTLMTAPGNDLFRRRNLLIECTDCPVLGSCKGGCRSTHEDEEINDVVCEIRRNILGKIQSGYYTNQQQNNHQCNCNHNQQEDKNINSILDDYIKNIPKIEGVIQVETPTL